VIGFKNLLFLASLNFNSFTLGVNACYGLISECPERIEYLFSELPFAAKLLFRASID
jgi:hypothetical protein